MSPGPGARRVIAGNPEARRRVGKAYAELLAVVLGAVAALGGLLLWHFSRRARVIRARLGNPRRVRWPLPDGDVDRTEGTR